jgi:hypothetical protein
MASVLSVTLPTRAIAVIVPCPSSPPLFAVLRRQFTDRELAESDRQGAIRAEAVKGAMLHVWAGYREKAWGTDEVRPKSGSGRATWGGACPGDQPPCRVNQSCAGDVHTFRSRQPDGHI